MRNMLSRAALASLAFALSGVGIAAELVGVVQDINAEKGVVTVDGIDFHLTDTTDFDMAFSGIDDLQRGQQVELDFDVVEGRHLLNQIRPEPLEP
jgi:Cu/Ag efflux protein CusF